MGHGWHGRRAGAVDARVRSTWRSGIISTRSTRSRPRLHAKKPLEDQHNDEAPNLARDVVLAEAEASALRCGAWIVALCRVRADTSTGDGIENPPLRRDARL